MQTGTHAYDQLAAQNRRQELILEHLWLVRHIVGRMAARFPPGIDAENLEAAGTLGLVEAASKFDAERGVKFETFACLRIRGAVYDEMRRNCPLPQHLLERVARVRKAYEDMRPGTTVEQLAEAAGMSADEVADCLAAMRLTRMVSWEGASETAEHLQTDRRDQPDANLQRAEQKRQIAEALTALPERERLVVTLYYLEDLRLKEIGQVLELSESRISRLLNAAIFHLGEYLRERD